MNKKEMLTALFEYISDAPSSAREARTPLPEQRIMELYYIEKNWNPKDFARAIEQEHGIVDSAKEYWGEW
jgi:hypothetical protein